MTDKTGEVKGPPHVRIREDGAGCEFSQMISNFCLGADLMNQLFRGEGGNARHAARTLTLGRNLIVGQKTLTLTKTVMSQQAAFQATKKHDAERMAEADKNSSKGANTRQAFQELKVGVYGDYAQSHAKLPGRIPKNKGTGAGQAWNTKQERTTARRPTQTSKCPS